MASNPATTQDVRLIEDFLEAITHGQNLTAGPSTQIPNAILVQLLRDKARLDWMDSRDIFPFNRKAIDDLASCKP